MNETDILYSIADAEVTSDEITYLMRSKYGADSDSFKRFIADTVESIRIRDNLHAASTSEVTKLIVNDWKEQE